MKKKTRERIARKKKLCEEEMSLKWTKKKLLENVYFQTVKPKIIYYSLTKNNNLNLMSIHNKIGGELNPIPTRILNNPAKKIPSLSKSTS